MIGGRAGSEEKCGPPLLDGAAGDPMRSSRGPGTTANAHEADASDVMGPGWSCRPLISQLRARRKGGCAPRALREETPRESSRARNLRLTSHVSRFTPHVANGETVDASSEARRYPRSTGTGNGATGSVVLQPRGQCVVRGTGSVPRRAQASFGEL